MRKLILIFAFFASILAYAQEDKAELRKGNRQFKRGEFKESEISYRKALIKDSTSVAAHYNLASTLYRQQDFEGAKASIDKALSHNANAAGQAGEAGTQAGAEQNAAASDRIDMNLGGDKAQLHFNAGDIALQLKDYASAVKEFREYLLEHPEDLEAKENYIYAKKMLQNQQNQQNQEGEQSDQSDQKDEGEQGDQGDQKDEGEQNEQDKQNENQPSNQQNEPDKSGDDSQQAQQPKISSQQAQQMLNAIQAREKETQDKVDKQKAAILQSRQKDKNW